MKRHFWLGLVIVVGLAISALVSSSVRADQTPSCSGLKLKTVISGTPISLCWTTTNPPLNPFCLLTADPKSGASGTFDLPQSPNGSADTASLTDPSYTFIISCRDQDNPNIVFSDSVSVTVTPPCPTVDLKLNGQDGPAGSPVAVNDGDGGTISWTVQNAASCTASGKDTFNSSRSPTDGSQASGPFTAPPTTYPLTLTCSAAQPTSCSDASDTVNVQVNCPNADFSLAANPPSLSIRYLVGSARQSNSTKTNLSVKPDGCGHFQNDVSLSAGPSTLGGVNVQYVFGKTRLPSGEYVSGTDFYVQPANPNVPIPKTTKDHPYQITITGLGGGLTRTATVQLNVNEVAPGYQEF